jgi:two-component sensor histidine kinase
LVLIVSLIIGLGSILYTNRLVSEIREREKKQVALYAKSLEFLANQDMTGGDLLFILDEIVQANSTIPVILTDQNGLPEDYRNLPKASELDEENRKKYLLSKIRSMIDSRDPIQVNLVDNDGVQIGRKYIYYEDSSLLYRLRFYPYVQLMVIALFGLVTYTIFNYSRSSEQNRVWVGLAKETAHQLGTPLSSLMAWVEYLKSKYANDPHIKELDQDIQRLEMITERFSSIGSEPKLQTMDIKKTIQDSVDYLKPRLSKKISFEVAAKPDVPIMVEINPGLFSWVLENLFKNAVDAMIGEGNIHVSILKINYGNVALDIRDTGKGIPKSKMKTVFKPGYTTKKRGWGLGLTLVKRIIENYHNGKIFVKDTDPKKGTTFRIVLRGLGAGT